MDRGHEPPATPAALTDAHETWRSLLFPFLSWTAIIFLALEGRWSVVLFAGLVLFVLRPLSTLVHELGHASAVVLLARRPARIEVFGAVTVSARIGMIDLRVALLPLSDKVRGVCAFDPAGLNWRTRGWISLCGPLATLLEIVLLAGTYPLWITAPKPVSVALLITGLMLIVSLVANLIPTQIRMGGQDRPVVIGRDGWSARRMFANARAGVPQPPSPPAVVARARERHGLNPARLSQLAAPSATGGWPTLGGQWEAVRANDPNGSPDP